MTGRREERLARPKVACSSRSPARRPMAAPGTWYCCMAATSASATARNSGEASAARVLGIGSGADGRGAGDRRSRNGRGGHRGGDGRDLGGRAAGRCCRDSQRGGSRGKGQHTTPGEPRRSQRGGIHGHSCSGGDGRAAVWGEHGSHSTRNPVPRQSVCSRVNLLYANCRTRKQAETRVRSQTLRPMAVLIMGVGRTGGKNPCRPGV